MTRALLVGFLLVCRPSVAATVPDMTLVPIPTACRADAAPLPAAEPPLEVRAPRFLESLWRAHVTGTVQLRLTVGSTGLVSDACLVRGVNALADRAAAQAARFWRFPPAAAAAREATATFTYSFEEAPVGLGPGPTATVFQPPSGVLLLATPLPPEPGISVSHARRP